MNLPSNNEQSTMRHDFVVFSDTAMTQFYSGLISLDLFCTKEFGLKTLFGYTV